MTFAIETDNLTKCYDGRPVVHALNLRIPVGCVYGFLGRNGAGKSTTIRMLTGLTPPDAGSAKLLGQDIQGLAPATRARIAYIGEGHPLYGGMTIAEAERFTRSFYPRWRSDLLAPFHTPLTMSNVDRDGLERPSYSRTGFPARPHACEPPQQVPMVSEWPRSTHRSPCRTSIETAWKGRPTHRVQGPSQ